MPKGKVFGKQDTEIETETEKKFESNLPEDFVVVKVNWDKNEKRDVAPISKYVNYGFPLLGRLPHIHVVARGNATGKALLVANKIIEKMRDFGNEIQRQVPEYIFKEPKVDTNGLKYEVATFGEPQVTKGVFSINLQITK